MTSLKCHEVYERTTTRRYCFCLLDIHLPFYYVTAKGSYLKSGCLFCIVLHTKIREAVESPGQFMGTLSLQQGTRHQLKSVLNAYKNIILSQLWRLCSCAVRQSLERKNKCTLVDFSCNCIFQNSECKWYLRSHLHGERESILVAKWDLRQKISTVALRDINFVLLHSPGRKAKYFYMS